MDTLELIKRRRSIRKFQQKELPEELLQKIIEAGLYAPNAGGGQRAFICAVRGRELGEKIGRLNIARFDRSKLAGLHVSSEQPSVIDDPTMKSGFYGASDICVICGPKDFLYSVPDAFCCATVMTLAAASLGVASCIVARAEETFDNSEGAAMLKEWGIPENYVPRCFLLLGYCEGEYPDVKPRRANRWKIVK